ncbi:helix-turn-helix transcriptional regulator [Streptomyces sp. NPDC002033]|uniref:helix-turn-helix domain-containing protein n=1 Tax=unclassified Streptomyces TaxID=2593676 RepID=UPI003330FB7B
MLSDNSRLPDRRSPDQRHLAAALSAVQAATGRSQRAIAEAAGISPGTLSTHLSGARVPTEPLMESFYTAAHNAAKALGGTLPFTLGQLQNLRNRACARHCPCCTAANAGQVPGPADSISTGGSTDRRTPAFSTAYRLRHERRARRKRVLSSRPAGASPAAQVPVPSRRGDRHPAEQDGAATWTELETVARYLSQNRDRDAGILLWQAGATMTASQILDVVSSCRNTGLDEAADAVLTSVSERSDRQAVLNITAAFQQAGRHHDVGYLLSVSAQ